MKIDSCMKGFYLPDDGFRPQYKIVPFTDGTYRVMTRDDEREPHPKHPDWIAYAFIPGCTYSTFDAALAKLKELKGIKN